MTEHVEVAIVGAGQAGLATSWHLGRLGVGHVVLDAATPMHSWTDSRWDAFTLVTPNWHCRLPGYRYDGPDPDGFMTRDEVAAWLAGWLDTFEPPVRPWSRVTRLRRADAGFELTVSTPDGVAELTCDHAVVASGGYSVPLVPPFAASIDPAVAQVHSARYRNPGALPAGEVLVVGSGQSGTQIAEDLHLAGRRVHLAVGGAPRVARTYRGRDSMTWLAEMGVYDRPAPQRPGGAAAIDKTNHYVTGRDGGRDVDLRRLATEGMRLYGSLADAAGTTLHFLPTLRTALDHADAVYDSICADIDRYVDAKGIDAPPPSRYDPVWQPTTETTELDAAGIGCVVWAIGYRPDYRWIEAGAFDGAGRPLQTRGVTAVPGLSFIGLPWMHTWGSGRFLGIDADAHHLARTIADGRRGTSPRLSLAL